MFHINKTSKNVILDTIKSEILKGNFHKTDHSFYMDTWTDYIIPIKKLKMEIILSTYGNFIGTDIKVKTDNKILCDFYIFSRKYYNFMKNYSKYEDKVEYYEKISELEKFTRGY